MVYENIKYVWYRKRICFPQKKRICEVPFGGLHMDLRTNFSWFKNVKGFMIITILQKKKKKIVTPFSPSQSDNYCS